MDTSYFIVLELLTLFNVVKTALNLKSPSGGVAKRRDYGYSMSRFQIVAFGLHTFPIYLCLPLACDNSVVLFTNGTFDVTSLPRSLQVVKTAKICGLFVGKKLQHKKKTLPVEKLTKCVNGLSSSSRTFLFWACPNYRHFRFIQTVIYNNSLHLLEPFPPMGGETIFVSYGEVWRKI